MNIETAIEALTVDLDAWNRLTKEVNILRDELAAMTAERDRYRLALAEVACIQAGVE